MSVQLLDNVWIVEISGISVQKAALRCVMLLDMQEQLIEAKKQVAYSIADEKRLLKYTS